VTVLLYYFGPIPWEGRKDPWVAILVGTCVLAFNLGYMSLSNPKTRRFSDYPLGHLLLNKQIAIGVMIAYAGLSLLHMEAVSGQSLLTVLQEGGDLNTVYSDYQAFLQDRLNLGLLDRVVLLMKGLLFPVALFLVCSFYKRSTLILLLFFGPMLLLSLARGTDKETFDLTLIFAIMAYYHGMGRRSKLAVLVAVPTVLYFFVARRYGRFGGSLPDCLPGSIVCFDFDSNLAQISHLLEIGFVLATNYITQGYEGLNIAFGLSFEPTFGLGHLQSVKNVACSFLQVGCNLETYGDRLYQFGWDARFRWSSVYTALANDLHWLLLPAYFFFIGWTLRLAEQDWQARRNPSALAVIVLIGVFTLYSSANMQLGITFDWAMATIFLLYGKALTSRTRGTAWDARLSGTWTKR
jgi:hypothetical protein